MKKKKTLRDQNVILRLNYRCTVVIEGTKVRGGTVTATMKVPFYS